MRPIDADKLIEYFQERLYVYEGNDDTKERYAHMAYVRSLNAIKNAPTIEIPTKCHERRKLDRRIPDKAMPELWCDYGGMT